MYVIFINILNIYDMLSVVCINKILFFKFIIFFNSICAITKIKKTNFIKLLFKVKM